MGLPLAIIDFVTGLMGIIDRHTNLCSAFGNRAVHDKNVNN